ncbi:MAG: hypothetical protein JWN34_4386 [Bryobacterales bacterium]|nr:hypothetical protein [Bryobacterales bacterium]
MSDQTVQIPGPMASAAKWLLVVVIWCLVLAAVGGVVLAVHHQWTPSGANATDPTKNRDDQCEELNVAPGTNAGTVLEVQNTWSNAGYLLAGMLILFCSYRPMGKAVGLQLVILSALSGYYHATLQPDAQLLDVASIYFALATLLLFGVQASFIRFPEGVWDWICTGVITIVLFVGGYKMAENRSKVYLFGSTTVAFTLVCAIIVLCVWQMCRARFNWGTALQFWRLWARDGAPWYEYLMIWRMFVPAGDSSEAELRDWTLRSYFWVFAAIGGVSLLCRLLDGDDKPLCSPHAPFQAHAIWHVASSITLLATYDLFSWTSFWDFTVFPRPAFGRQSSIPLTGLNDFLSGYGPSVAAVVLGLLLFALSFSPGTFVDKPRDGDTAGDPLRTGILIALTFIVGGVGVALLQWRRAIPRADA